MDNFSDRDENQFWDFCCQDPDTQPCQHQQAVVGHLPGFQKKRYIPSEVLEQLDRLLEQASQAMVEGKDTPILSPTMWDAILILRNTVIRLSELEHLQVSSQAEHPGCLEQDANGFWWLHTYSPKMGKDSRIPIQGSSGVIEAIYRQRQRIIGTPEFLHGEYHLFPSSTELSVATAITRALRKLAIHLTYEEQPYVISPHQFRYTMVGNALVLGHLLHHTNSLPTTMYYLHDYRSSLDI